MVSSPGLTLLSCRLGTVPLLACAWVAVPMRISAVVTASNATMSARFLNVARLASDLDMCCLVKSMVSPSACSY